jgi:hypothetical protein
LEHFETSKGPDESDDGAHRKARYGDSSVLIAAKSEDAAPAPPREESRVAVHDDDVAGLGR